MWNVEVSERSPAARINPRHSELTLPEARILMRSLRRSEKGFVRPPLALYSK